jgi:hypothetical protein
MRSDPEQVRATVPENVSDWHGLALADYLSGPFEDRTGGLITFRAAAYALLNGLALGLLG